MPTRQTSRSTTASTTAVALGLALILGGCALSPVGESTRDRIDARVQPGMPMRDARAELESMHYRCTTRRGAYFDAHGDEHQVAGAFQLCTARPGTISFQCNVRTQVTLVPDGERVGKVVITRAPSCMKQ